MSIGLLQAQRPGQGSNTPQENLFEPVPQHELSHAQKLAIDKAMEQDYAIQAWVVKPDHLGNHWENHEVNIQMPFDVTRSYTQHYVNSYPNTSSFIAGNNPVSMNSSSDYSARYYWVGHNTNGGSFQMYQDNNRIRADIYVGETGKAYKVFTHDENIFICLQYDREKVRDEGVCSLGDEEEDDENACYKEEIETEVDFRYCEHKQVRVLFLYTSRAESIDDPDFVADQMVEQLNAAASSSGLSTSELEFISAGTRLFTFTNHRGETDESTNIKEDIKSVDDAPSFDIARDETFADIVIVLTDNNYGSVGLARKIKARENKAYAIIEIGEAVGSFFTGVHEIGHLFGARHQRKCECATDKDNKGKHHGLKIDGGLMTVMAVCDNRINISSFSNLTNPFQGEVIGNGDNNNTLALSERAGTVACFRDDPPEEIAPNSLSIEGPSSICRNSGFHSFSAFYNIESVSTYSWEVSTNPFVSWQSIGTDNTDLEFLSANFPPAATSNFFFIRLTVHTSTNTTSSALKIVTFDNCLQEEVDNRSNNDQEEVIHNSNLLYNNPVKNILNIKSHHLLKRLSIFSLRGQLLLQKEVNNTQEEISVHHLSSGIYFVKLEQNNHFQVFKFIKI